MSLLQTIKSNESCREELLNELKFLNKSLNDLVEKMCCEPGAPVGNRPNGKVKKLIQSISLTTDSLESIRKDNIRLKGKLYDCTGPTSII